MVRYILHMDNRTALKGLGADLTKKVLAVAVENDADTVIIHEASYNKTAIIELLINGTSVLWDHKVRAW